MVHHQNFFRQIERPKIWSSIPRSWNFRCAYGSHFFVWQYICTCRLVSGSILCTGPTVLSWREVLELWLGSTAPDIFKGLAGIKPKLLRKEDLHCNANILRKFYFHRKVLSCKTDFQRWMEYLQKYKRRTTSVTIFSFKILFFKTALLLGTRDVCKHLCPTLPNILE